MLKLPFLLFFSLLVPAYSAVAQTAKGDNIGKVNQRFGHQDSLLQDMQNIPNKYFIEVQNKINTYSNRISKKTTKTLEKLSKWESKVKSMLDKVSPETSAQLFGDGKLTFSGLLQQMQRGEQTSLQYQTYYDRYRDDLTSSMKYLAEQKKYVDEKVLVKATQQKEKMDQLNKLSDSSEAIEQFIKERKKELINTAFQYLGKSKYLIKINKEAWYYAETMKNYKELFRDEKKMEQTAKTIMNKIPAFQQFMQKNSMLNSLFGQPGDLTSASDITNLQTRDGISDLIGQRISAGGPNAMQQVQQNIQMGQSELNKLKDKLLKSPTFGNGGETLPDFKVNTEKSKTFKQRLEYNTDLQFAKNNSLMPTIADIAVGVGYRLSAKALAGFQVGYKLGMGNLNRIKFSNQGISFRSFMDIKLKGQLFISSGIEMNYLSDLPVGYTIAKYENGWQKAALAGLSKKINIKTKWFKETKLSLLYDFLANQNLPKTTSILFRVGYNF